MAKMTRGHGHDDLRGLMRSYWPGATKCGGNKNDPSQRALLCAGSFDEDAIPRNSQNFRRFATISSLFSTSSTASSNPLSESVINIRDRDPAREIRCTGHQGEGSASPSWRPPSAIFPILAGWQQTMDNMAHNNLEGEAALQLLSSRNCHLLYSSIFYILYSISADMSK